MKASLIVRRSVFIAMALVAAFIAITAGLLVAVDSGHGRSLVAGLVGWRLHRPVEVRGPLRAHLFSRSPWIVAEAVTIGNPPWVPAGTAAEVGKVTAVLALPGPGLPSGITQLALEGATFHLTRDATSHANWQLIDPSKPQPRRNSWIVRRLSIPDARVVLADELRHRHFAGTVSAEAPYGSVDGALRIDGAGQLNGRSVSFRLTGDPLSTASHETPYHFSFVERSSGSHLEARGLLPRPFDFKFVDAAFEAGGPDLKDLYFLTGVRLLDTGPYHLAARASRRDKLTEYRELVATSGQSDLHGSISIDSTSRRRKYAMDLDSEVLYLSDLGARAAGGASVPESPLLFSNASVSSRLVRACDATIRFRAGTVVAGRLSLQDVSAKASMDRGVFAVAPLVAKVEGGTLEARLRFDARGRVPAANLDLKLTDFQLGQLPHKNPGAPPIEGALQARVTLTGTGSSLHQVAASANGTVRVQISQGAMRESMAELASGIDLKGLGLLLTRSQREVPVRCAIANFNAENGTLVAENMVADTDPALITGEGRIHLDTEALDFEIHGHPRKTRLFRLREPIAVQGTLLHPSVTVDKSKSRASIFDRGEAGDVDCGKLLADSSASAPPAQAPH